MEKSDCEGSEKSGVHIKYRTDKSVSCNNFWERAISSHYLLYLRVIFWFTHKIQMLNGGEINFAVHLNHLIGIAITNHSTYLLPLFTCGFYSLNWIIFTIKFTDTPIHDRIPNLFCCLIPTSVSVLVWKRNFFLPWVLRCDLDGVMH